MNDVLAELQFFRREALTAQQQLFAYLALHKVGFDEPKVHDALNREPLAWLTLRESALQSCFTTLGRIFDQDSAHNVDALLRLVGQNLPVFSRTALVERRVAEGLPLEDAERYAADKHDLDAVDLRAMRRRVAALRKLWDATYRQIRHQVFAHSEVIETTDLFATTRIDELVEMLGSLEDLYEDLDQAQLNGRKPGSRQHRPLQFPVNKDLRKMRSGELAYRQTEAMLYRLAGLAPPGG